jgi:hypothetical protein
MQKYSIELPSIRDDEKGYSYLTRLAQNIIGDPYRHFDFNFRKCAVLDQNAVALIGGLARYVDAHNTFANAFRNGHLFPACGVMFQVDSMSQLISNQLVENNFLSHFSNENFSGSSPFFAVNSSQ